MKINFDYHTHTKFSHGKGTILENALSAKEKGLKGITISDHGFSHPAFGMRRWRLDKMKSQCLEAERQTGIKVNLGIESNILGERGRIDVKEKDYEKLDMILAGVHRMIFFDTVADFCKLHLSNIFCSTFKQKPAKWLIDYNTKAYVNAIKNNPIDILTHMNYLVYADAKTVAKACADYGTYIEINTKKIHLSLEEWQDVIDTGVNFVIDSDAHSPSRIGDTKLFESQSEYINFPLDRIHNVGDKSPSFRFKAFKEKL